MEAFKKLRFVQGCGPGLRGVRVEGVYRTTIATGNDGDDVGSSGSGGGSGGNGTSIHASTSDASFLAVRALFPTRRALEQWECALDLYHAYMLVLEGAPVYYGYNHDLFEASLQSSISNRDNHGPGSSSLHRAVLAQDMVKIVQNAIRLFITTAFSCPHNGKADEANTSRGNTGESTSIKDIESLAFYVL